MEPSRRVNVERLVERQLSSWKTRAKARESRGAAPAPEQVEETMGPFVSVSREVGSGGNELAAILARRLGYSLYDREIVDYIAERANVRAAAVKSLGETWYNATHNWISGVIDRRFLGCDEYVRHLIEVVGAIASHGPAVFVGRGVAFILPSRRGLRVRVVAPFEQRVSYAVDRWNMSDSEARKLILTSDASQHGFIKAYYKADTCDPLIHDVTLNMDQVSLEVAADVCVAMLKARGLAPG